MAKVNEKREVAAGIILVARDEVETLCGARSVVLASSRAGPAKLRSHTESSALASGNLVGRTACRNTRRACWPLQIMDMIGLDRYADADPPRSLSKVPDFGSNAMAQYSTSSCSVSDGRKRLLRIISSGSIYRMLTTSKLVERTKSWPEGL